MGLVLGFHPFSVWVLVTSEWRLQRDPWVSPVETALLRMEIRKEEVVWDPVKLLPSWGSPRSTSTKQSTCLQGIYDLLSPSPVFSVQKQKETGSMNDNPPQGPK